MVSCWATEHNMLESNKSRSLLRVTRVYLGDHNVTSVTKHMSTKHICTSQSTKACTTVLVSGKGYLIKK